MKAKLKYPCKVGNVLYPLNTEVEIVKLNDDRAKNIRETFPNIKEKPQSTRRLVVLPGKETATIFDTTQLIEDEQ